MISLSFRGVTFSWEERSSELTPRFAEHDFPQKAGRWHEDMAAGPRVFKFMAFLVAPTRDLARARLKRLQAACADQRPGTLMHPVFGAIRCVCTAFESKEGVRKLGRIELDMTFVEDAGAQFPISGRWVGAALSDAVELAADAASAGFDQVWNLRGTPTYVRTQAAGGLLELAGVVSGTLGLLTAAVRGTVSDRTSRLPDLATDDYGQSTTLRSVFAGYTTADNGRPLPLTGAQAATTSAALRRLSTFTLPAVAGLTFSRAVAAMALAGLAVTTRRLALIEEANVTRRLAFVSADEAIAVRDSLADRLDVEILAAADQASDDGNDVLARVSDAMATVRTEMITDLTERAASLKPVGHITLRQVRPAIALAYALYGDDDASAGSRARTLELALDIGLRNRVRDPGQMPGGVALEYQAS